MQLLPSNIGRRWTLHQAKTLGPGRIPEDLDPALWTLLLELCRNQVVPFPCEGGARALYPGAAREGQPALLRRLEQDGQNYRSDLVDVGGGPRTSGGAGSSSGRSGVKIFPAGVFSARGLP